MDLLYRDSKRIIVGKLSGRSTEETLQELKKRVGREVYPIHRVDQPVSGPLLVALSSEEAGHLSAQLRAGTIRRTYVAVCERPDVPVEEGRWNDLLSWNRKGNRAFVSTDGKPAALNALRIGKTERYDVWRFELKTGRHHQIRIQCANRGIPVVGDLKYGARRSKRGGGIYLHGYSIEIPIPERLISFCYPPRESLWNAALAVLQAP